MQAAIYLISNESIYAVTARLQKRRRHGNLRVLNQAATMSTYADTAYKPDMRTTDLGV